MRVAMWYNNRDIRIEEVPTPKAGPGEILVKVEACGICGSDIVEWYRLPRAPLVPGHELGGVVEGVGPGVTGFKPGGRVFVPPKVPCMECRYCLAGHHPVCAEVPDRTPGGFAEYILVPEGVVKNGVTALPDEVGFDQSTFIEPLACVVRAQRLAGIEAGQLVLVMGCGMSGLLHIKLARQKGAKVAATDVSRSRLELAAELGAEITLEAGEDVPGLLGEKKADVVLLCTSALAAIEQAWDCLDKGATMVFFAVPGPDKDVCVPVNSFWTREIRIITSYYCAPGDLAEALELIRSGQVLVDDLITHRLPLEEIEQGFELVLEGSESLKVIIKPWGIGQG